MMRLPRSQPARDRILSAAKTVFAREGYDRATIRLIAEEALVNPAIIIRYYGSKENLFATATPLNFKGEALLSVPRDKIGEALVAHVLGRWEDTITGEELTGLLRASLSHEGARERIVEVFEDQVRRLIGALKPVGDVSAVAPLIATQMLGLAFSRYVLLIPSVVNLSAENVIRDMGAIVQRLMDKG